MVKKITIERLAVMIQNGFQETASRQEMDEKFKAVDEKFKAVADQLDFVDGHAFRLQLWRLFNIHEFAFVFGLPARVFRLVPSIPRDQVVEN